MLIHKCSFFLVCFSRIDCYKKRLLWSVYNYGYNCSIEDCKSYLTLSAYLSLNNKNFKIALENVEDSFLEFLLFRMI